MRRTIVTILLASCMLMPAAHAELPVDPAWESRYHALIDELRCLVCQNQNLAESNAPLALDLREEVKEMLAAGRSDGEIKQFMTERYGDFVLYRPPLKSWTWLLWFGPFLLLLVGLTMAVRFVRRRPVGESGRNKVDAATVQKILDDES